MLNWAEAPSKLGPILGPGFQDLSPPPKPDSRLSPKLKRYKKGKNKNNKGKMRPKEAGKRLTKD